ncbi:MAG: response regulator [Phycisphaerae bacterium]
MPTTVLVVDDAAFMRFMLKKEVTQLGYSVIGEAGDGEEACRLFDELEPDVVTLDLVMPKKGGMDTLRDIRAKHPDARIVIVSAVEQRTAIMDAIKHGAVDYIVKPFKADQLQCVLERVSKKTGAL